MDPVRFRTKGVSYKGKSFKISSIKKPKETKTTFTLEGLLAEANKNLERIKKELKVNLSDKLLDDYTKFEDLIRQLKNQIIVRRKKT